MKQVDIFGAAAPDGPADRAKHLRTWGRPTVAEQKADLIRRIEALCNNVPPRVRNCSIQQTREWTEHRAKAMAAVKSTRSSIPMLEMAEKQMRAWL